MKSSYGMLLDVTLCYIDFKNLLWYSNNQMNSKSFSLTKSPKKHRQYGGAFLLKNGEKSKNRERCMAG